jgi:hypothetical protein
MITCTKDGADVPVSVALSSNSLDITLTTPTPIDKAMRCIVTQLINPAAGAEFTPTITTRGWWSYLDTIGGAKVSIYAATTIQLSSNAGFAATTVTVAFTRLATGFNIATLISITGLPLLTGGNLHKRLRLCHCVNHNLHRCIQLAFSRLRFPLPSP